MNRLKELQVKKVNENYISQKCNNLIKEAGVKKAPVNHLLLASFAGISKVIEEDIEVAGMLIPDGCNFKIVLRKGDSETRKRFSCCHEISHTFMPDYQLSPQTRVDKVVGLYDPKDNIEYLCDHGAAELLMPPFLFNKRFAEVGFDIRGLLSLAAEFNTSLEATAIKMVKSNLEKYAVIIWEEGYKPSELGRVVSPTLPGMDSYKPEKKFRIKMGFGFGPGCHIPQYKSLDEDQGIISIALATNTAFSGFENIDFGSFSVSCNVFAYPLSKNKILTLLEK